MQPGPIFITVLLQFRLMSNFANPHSFLPFTGKPHGAVYNFGTVRDEPHQDASYRRIPYSPPPTLPARHSQSLFGEATPMVAGVCYILTYTARLPSDTLLTSHSLTIGLHR